jgi:hypothetical protein
MKAEELLKDAKRRITLSNKKFALMYDYDETNRIIDELIKRNDQLIMQLQEQWKLTQLGEEE